MADSKGAIERRELAELGEQRHITPGSAPGGDLEVAAFRDYARQILSLRRKSGRGKDRGRRLMVKAFNALERALEKNDLKAVQITFQLLLGDLDEFARGSEIPSGAHGFLIEHSETIKQRIVGVLPAQPQTSSTSSSSTEPAAGSSPS